MTHADDGGSPHSQPRTPPGPYSYTAEKRAAALVKGDKHGHDDDEERPKSNKHANAFFGQVSALPAATDTGNDEDMEAMRYLSTVRSEAMGMATVFSARIAAPAEEWEDYDQDDDQGWYEDGAYIANTTTHEHHPPDSSMIDISSLYCRAVCLRFEQHRYRMRQQPTDQSVSSLDSQHPTQRPTPTRRDDGSRIWKHHLHNTSPVPAQLASMDTTTILFLLDIAEDSLKATTPYTDISPVLSQWIWALLGRLDNISQLATQDVGVVRSLAKAAALLCYKYRVARQVQDGDSNADDKDHAQDADEKHVSADHAKQQVPNPGTLATLEMIIIVASELYGQRDLISACAHLWNE